MRALWASKRAELALTQDPRQQPVDALPHRYTPLWNAGDCEAPVSVDVVASAIAKYGPSGNCNAGPMSVGRSILAQRQTMVSDPQPVRRKLPELKRQETCFTRHLVARTASFTWSMVRSV